MNKKIRITILSLILAYVSVGAYCDMNHNWDRPTTVVVHPMNVDGDPKVQAYIDRLKQSDFDAMETFIAENGRKYRGKKTEFKVVLGPQIYRYPKVPNEEIASSIPKTIAWSLGLRFFGLRNMTKEDWQADSVMYLSYYNIEGRKNEIDRSSALERGRIGVVGLYAGEIYTQHNNVVILHETLHTLGATDRYDLSTGIPIYPDGYAEPDKEPLYPQTKAEIMGGYVPLNEQDFMVPDGFNEVIMNEVTAKELGWIKPRPGPKPLKFDVAENGR